VPIASATLMNPLPRLELDAISREAAEQGVPVVDSQVGALLHVLTRAAKAARVLEIGTGIGASAVWMATALPTGGMLITLERDSRRAEAARRHVAAAGLADRVSVMVGEASRYLHKLAGPFDLIFQDGDPSGDPRLLDRLVSLLAPSGMLIQVAGNMPGEAAPGALDASPNAREDTKAIATYNKRLAADARLVTVMLPIGGGVAIAARRADLTP
jgi:predicted O-methyltransferase YrrM